MFCPQCGAENPPDSKFCMRDGAALNMVTSPEVSSTGVSRPSRVGRSLGSVPRLPLIGGVLVVLALFGGFQLFSAWQAGQQRDAYTRGVQAFGDKDYETAVDMFKKSGDYLDSKSRLDDAQKKVGEALPHYDSGVQALQKGLSWDAAYEFRQTLEVDPKFRDGAQELLQARAKLGRLVWVTVNSGGGTNSNSSSSSLWSAPADAGNAKELGSGSFNARIRAFPATGQVVFAIANGSRQTLYVSDSDGGNRKEIVTADSIEDVRTGAVADTSGSNQGLETAPGTQFLVIASSATSTQKNAPIARTLYSVALPGGSRKELMSVTDRGLSITDVTPDLSQAVVESRANSSGRFANVSVSLVDVAAGTHTDVVSGTNADARMSPDGAALFTTYAEVDNRGTATEHAALVRPAAQLQVDLGTADSMYGWFSDDSRLFGEIVSPKNNSLQTFRIVDAQTGGSVDVLQGQVDTWLHTDAGKVFIAVREGSNNQSRSVIYAVDENGQNRVEVASGDSVSMRQLGNRVFIVLKEKNRSQKSFFVIGGDGTGYVDLGSGTDASGAALSPDGSHVALVVTDPTRGQSTADRLLVYDMNIPGAGMEIASAPRISFGGWSPDGSRLVFMQYTGTSTSSNSTGGIYVADPTATVKPVKLLDGVAGLLGWVSLPNKA